MKNVFLKIWAIAGLSLFVVSCSEDEDDMPMQQAKVMVVHASPNAPAVDIRVNNTIAASNLSFPNNTPYANVNAGNTNIKVSPTGTTTNVIDANVDLAANTNYSVFAVNTVNNISASVVTDNLTTPAAGKAHVRFFHLAPDAPAVDIGVRGGATVFSNRAFNDQSTNAAVTNFTALDAGTYNLDVRLAGQSTAVLPLPPVTLEAGKIYTVFAKGLVAGTGMQALGAQVIVHN
jgi:hypothetical protein